MTTARFSEKTKQGINAVIKRYLVNKCDRYTIELRPQSDGAIKMFVLEYPADPCRKSVQESHINSRRRDRCGAPPRTGNNGAS